MSCSRSSTPSTASPSARESNLMKLNKILAAAQYFTTINQPMPNQQATK